MQKKSKYLSTTKCGSRPTEIKKEIKGDMQQLNGDVGIHRDSAMERDWKGRVGAILPTCAHRNGKRNHGQFLFP